MAFFHHLAAFIYLGSVERVEHGADKLSQRAGVYAAVAVKGDDIFYAAERIPLPRHFKLIWLIAEKPCQLHERTPLSLVGSIAFPVKAAAAGKKIKALSVFAVEAVYGI